MKYIKRVSIIEDTKQARIDVMNEYRDTLKQLLNKYEE